MKKGLLLVSSLALLLMAGCGHEEKKHSQDTSIHQESSEKLSRSTDASSDSKDQSSESTNTSTSKEKASSSTTESTVSASATSISVAPSQEPVATSSSEDIQEQKCPDYNEMTPEAKAEMEKYYDGNNDGIPDSQQSSSELKQDVYYDEYGNEVGDANEENLPPEDYQGGGDPAVQADTQRRQLEWARQQGLIE